jgi:hypothetical protein
MAELEEMFSSGIGWAKRLVRGGRMLRGNRELPWMR